MGSDLYMEERSRPCPPPPPLDEQVRALVAERDKLASDLGEKVAALSKLRTENDRLVRKVGEQEMELADLRSR